MKEKNGKKVKKRGSTSSSSTSKIINFSMKIQRFQNTSLQMYDTACCIINVFTLILYSKQITEAVVPFKSWWLMYTIIDGLVVLLTLLLIARLHYDNRFNFESGITSLGSERPQILDRLLSLLLPLTSLVVAPKLLAETLLVLAFPSFNSLSSLSNSSYGILITLSALLTAGSLACAVGYIRFFRLALPTSSKLASISSVPILCIITFPAVTLFTNMMAEHLDRNGRLTEEGSIFLMLLKAVFPLALIGFTLIRGGFFIRKWKKLLAVFTILACFTDQCLFCMAYLRDYRSLSVILAILAPLAIKLYQVCEIKIASHVPERFSLYDAIFASILCLQYTLSPYTMSNDEVTAYLKTMQSIKRSARQQFSDIKNDELADIRKVEPVWFVMKCFDECLHKSSERSSTSLRIQIYLAYFLLIADAGLMTLTNVTGRLSSKTLSTPRQLILEYIKSEIRSRLIRIAHEPKKPVRGQENFGSLDCSEKEIEKKHADIERIRNCQAVYLIFTRLDTLLEKMSEYSDYLKAFYEELQMKKVNVMKLHKLSTRMLEVDKQVTSAFDSMQSIAPPSIYFHTMPFAMFLHNSTNNNRRARSLLGEFKRRRKMAYFSAEKKDIFTTISPGTVVVSSSAESASLGRIRYASGNYSKLYYQAQPSQQQICNRNIYELIGDESSKIHSEIVRSFLENMDKVYLGKSKERSIRLFGSNIYSNVVMVTVFNTTMNEGIELVTSIENVNKSSYFFIVSSTGAVRGISKGMSELSNSLENAVVGRHISTFSQDLVMLLQGTFHQDHTEVKVEETTQGFEPICQMPKRNKGSKGGNAKKKENPLEKPIRVMLPYGINFMAKPNQLLVQMRNYTAAQSSVFETQIYFKKRLFEAFDKEDSQVFAVTNLQKKSKELMLETKSTQPFVDSQNSLMKPSIYSQFLVPIFAKRLMNRKFSKNTKDYGLEDLNDPFELDFGMKYNNQGVLDWNGRIEEGATLHEGSIASMVTVAKDAKLPTIMSPKVGLSIRAYLITVPLMLIIISIAVYLCLYTTGSIVSNIIAEWVKGRSVHPFNIICRAYLSNSMSSLIEENLMLKGIQSRDKYAYLSPAAVQNPLNRYRDMNLPMMESVSFYNRYVTTLDEEKSSAANKFSSDLVLPLSVKSLVTRVSRVTPLSIITLIYILTEGWYENFSLISFNSSYYNAVISSIDTTGPKIIRVYANYLTIELGEVIAELQDNVSLGINWCLFSCELFLFLFLGMFYLYRMKIIEIYKIYRYVEEEDMKTKYVALQHWDTCIQEMKHKEDFNSRKLTTRKKIGSAKQVLRKGIVTRNRTFKAPMLFFFGLKKYLVALFIVLQALFGIILLFNNLLREKRINELEMSVHFRWSSTVHMVTLSALQYTYDAALMRGGIGRTISFDTQFSKMEVQLASLKQFHRPVQKFYDTGLKESVKPYFQKHIDMTLRPCREVDIAQSGIDPTTCENLGSGILKKGLFATLGWLISTYEDYLNRLKANPTKQVALNMLMEKEFLEMEFIGNRLTRPFFTAYTHTFVQATDSYIHQFEADFWLNVLLILSAFALLISTLTGVLLTKMWQGADISLYSLRVLPLGSIQRNSQVKFQVKNLKVNLL